MTRRLALLALVLALAACATFRLGEDRATLAMRHRQRAVALERDGSLRRALDEWKIARTINPDDTAARDGQARLQARIDRLVAERVAQGRAALARGAQAEARRRLLSALALDPSNRAAFTLLQTGVRDVEFLLYTVRPGDTLAGLAQRYYGDSSRGEVISETNRLPPNPRLAAGTTLKIPQIPGLPLGRGMPGAELTPPEPRAGESQTDPGHEEGDVNPLIAEARESLDRGEYTMALSDVDQLLSGDPGNREGLDLKKLVLYRQGKALLEQKSYDDSYRTFGQLARIQRDYEDLPRLLQDTRALMVEDHFRKGIELYREERLKEAIAEWRLVLSMDASHVSARKNIEQAEKLLHSLEERKRR